MKRPDIAVSDHAVLRFLERVRGLDIEGIRNEIRRTVTPAVVMGAGAMSSGGFTYLLKENRVTTIVPGKSPHYARLNGALHNGTGLRRIQRPEGRR